MDLQLVSFRLLAAGGIEPAAPVSPLAPHVSHFRVFFSVPGALKSGVSSNGTKIIVQKVHAGP